MVRLGPKIKPASEEDYIKLQGGKPEVSEENGLKVVTHNYEGGEGMVVRSHKDYGTSIILTKNGPREFDTNLLRERHGKPCERESRKA